MLNKIDIRNIKMDWLCSRCLMRISNYAKLAHDYDGTVIEIQSEGVLGQIRDHVVNLDNIELKLAYEKIKVEIKNRLGDPKLSDEISEEIIPSYITTGHDESRISRKEIIGRWFGLND